MCLPQSTPQILHHLPSSSHSTHLVTAVAVVILVAVHELPGPASHERLLQGPAGGHLQGGAPRVRGALQLQPQALAQQEVGGGLVAPLQRYVQRRVAGLRLLGEEENYG